MKIKTEQLLMQVADIAAAAGREIMDVYAGDFQVESKSDGSPLTEADRRAHNLIEARLARLAPHIPLLSEESDARAFSERRAWPRYWLVDPLDGTKGFIRRTDQFSVNIALIEGARAALGVVHAPVTGVSYFAVESGGAFKMDGGAARPIRTRKFDRAHAVMLVSRSHGSGADQAYRARLAAEGIALTVTATGSSLKICAVAEGLADIYPRLGPTSEWDTAAAHCVLTAAGGDITDPAGAPLQYNKEDILNSWFFAAGDTGFDWAARARELE
ncbi:MAG: 3'(2'),5'-bisphosphate nucleotidase CysQ [Gammaproteobacteria bacterium]